MNGWSGRRIGARVGCLVGSGMPWGLGCSALPRAFSATYPDAYLAHLFQTTPTAQIGYLEMYSAAYWVSIPGSTGVCGSVSELTR